MVYEITMRSQSASVLHFLTALGSPGDAAGMLWHLPVQVMHLLQRGGAARQDSFLCTLLDQVDWPVTWRGSEMTEPKAGALCGRVEGQTQLCLSHLLTRKAQQLRDTGSSPGGLCRAGVGTSEWDVSRIKSINLKL